MHKAIAAVLILTSGCVHPTAPEQDLRLTTAYGTVGVWSDGSTYDLGAIRGALERGQKRALAQRKDAPPLDGITVAVWKNLPWDCADGVGCYHLEDDSIAILSGVEEVADHELQHRQAWKLGLRGDCFMLQDHSPGFDLLCRPR